MKIAEQRRQIGTTMTHVSRIVEELVERLEGASRRVVPGAEPGGGARELLDATRSLLDDLTPVAQRQALSPAPATLDSLSNDAFSAIEPLLPRSVAMDRVPDIRLWPVSVDCEQIKRAFGARITNTLDGTPCE